MKQATREVGSKRKIYKAEARAGYAKGLSLKGGFFVRPEARLYLVNNNVDFSSPRVTRYGLSIGYTFK